MGGFKGWGAPWPPLGRKIFDQFRFLPLPWKNPVSALKGFQWYTVKIYARFPGLPLENSLKYQEGGGAADPFAPLLLYPPLYISIQLIGFVEDD